MTPPPPPRPASPGRVGARVATRHFSANASVAASRIITDGGPGTPAKPQAAECVSARVYTRFPSLIGAPGAGTVISIILTRM